MDGSQSMDCLESKIKGVLRTNLNIGREIPIVRLQRIFNGGGEIFFFHISLFFYRLLWNPNFSIQHKGREQASVICGGCCSYLCNSHNGSNFVQKVHFISFFKSKKSQNYLLKVNYWIEEFFWILQNFHDLLTNSILFIWEASCTWKLNRPSKL